MRVRRSLCCYLAQSIRHLWYVVRLATRGARFVTRWCNYSGGVPVLSSSNPPPEDTNASVGAIAAFAVVVCLDASGGALEGIHYGSALDMPSWKVNLVGRIVGWDVYSDYETMRGGSVSPIPGCRNRIEAYDGALHYGGYEFFKYFFYAKKGQDAVFGSDWLHADTIYFNEKIGTVVAFRGTKTASEWITNLHSMECDFLGGKVHSGFFNVAQSFAEMSRVAGRPGFKEALGTFLGLHGDACRRGEFFVTGHSQGGALCKHGAIYLQESLAYQHDVRLTENQLKLLAFEAPRIGDERFHEELKKVVPPRNSIDFYCYADPVPYAPFWGGVRI